MGIFSDYAGKKEKEKPTQMSKVAKWVVLVQAIAYILLIFVVVYGMNKMVYTGFPAIVPWLIMILFGYMSFRRIRTYLRLTQDQRTGKDQLYDEVFAEDDDDESYYKNYFK